jgi:sn-glycerol 3-phosphate transport system substrate-binding protein
MKTAPSNFLGFAAVLGIFAGAFANAEAPEANSPVEIRVWHSMSGSVGDKFNSIVEKYHGTQNKFRVNSVYKGNYTDALNGLVAAYRGSKQPHITQIFEVGTQSMMESGAIVPVEELFKKENVVLNKADFLGPVAGYYSQKDGTLISMPFNSSTPILFYNKDILAELGITKIPQTWEELFQVSKEIKAKSNYAGFIFGWQSWTLVENFSAINDLPIATPENGFLGLNVSMNLTNPVLSQFIAQVAEAIKNKEFLFSGRRTEAPRRSFLARKSAFFVDSSSSIGTMKKAAKFKWGTAFQPYLAGKNPHNSLIGGASLWVMKGHSDAEYKGVVDFLNFLTRADIQAEWHQATGYVPITKSAYALSTSQGYYAKDPDQETAVKQLLRGPMSINSRGIRLGNFSQVREVIEESLEKIWEGRMTTSEGLAEANERSNLVLSRFATLRSADTKSGATR